MGRSNTKNYFQSDLTSKEANNAYSSADLAQRRDVLRQPQFQNLVFVSHGTNDGTDQ